MQMPRPIRLIGGVDYDRGVVIKQSAVLGNLDVAMYKDSPGEYFSGNGKPISVEAARRAGFDVEHYEKLRKRNLASAHFLAKFDEANETAGTTRKVVFERAGYRVVSLGLDRHIVEDSDGFLLTPGKHLSLAQAQETLELFVPEVEAQAEVDKIEELAGVGGDGPRTAARRSGAKIAP